MTKFLKIHEAQNVERRLGDKKFVKSHLVITKQSKDTSKLLENVFL